ncbi:MAG: hypothetical protein ACT6QS_03800 [Flavobacteriales bacterium]
MLLSRFGIFKQRKPREFSYKPLYYKEEEEVDTLSDPGERIRAAYGRNEGGSSMRDKMESRRHFGGGYDPAKSSRKLIFLLMLLGIIAVVYFVYL